MTIVGGIAVYFVIWWMSIFLALPFGIGNKSEAGDVVKGSDPGAPTAVDVRRITLLTTIIATVVFVPVWYLWTVVGF